MTNDPHFWDNQKTSSAVMSELNSLKLNRTLVNDLTIRLKSNISMLSLASDLEMNILLTNDLVKIENQIAELEISLLLNGEYDHNSAILEIHPGAGGTESCDWARMLYRMYKRWAASHNYQVEVINEEAGLEAGLKSVTMIIKGDKAYGYLKGEKGVHRLVRISPFDANGRRHTSFAAVEVTPLFDNQTIDININEKDLRIDVYHASGHGGQGVNTTDSAVRITHLPTKIVVTCQNERSQIQNKAKAMEVLTNKLYQLELSKREQNLKDQKGNLSSIDFGSQIRSYILCPYTLVKDHRTNVEETNAVAVLDGNIDAFIKAYIEYVNSK